jgi:hypothetical protein
MNKELIELITDTVSKGNEVDVLTIYVVCEAQGFVRGTYTSYISMMKKAGYLRRVKHGVYAIGRPASAQTIALNLQRLMLHKKGVPPKMPRNAPKPVSSFPVVTSNEEFAKELLSEYNTAKSDLLRAVEVLKSFGFKVTIEF